MLAHLLAGKRKKSAIWHGCKWCESLGGSVRTAFALANTNPTVRRAVGLSATSCSLDKSQVNQRQVVANAMFPCANTHTSLLRECSTPYESPSTEGRTLLKTANQLLESLGGNEKPREKCITHIKCVLNQKNTKSVQLARFYISIFNILTGFIANFAE